MVKLLCKFQFRERDFQRLLWKCCSSTFNNCFIQWFQWFLFSSLQGKSNVRLTRGATGWFDLRTQGQEPDDNLYQHWGVCPVSDIWSLCGEGASKRRISLQGSTKCHFFIDFLQISLTETSTEKCFMWAAAVKTRVPPIVCERSHQFSQMKFSRRVRTLLHRKWQIRMKYKPVS